MATKNVTRAAVVSQMTKFEQILSLTGQALLDKRGLLIAKSTVSALDNKINQLERQKDVLDLEICNITDLSVKSNDSLCPVGPNFNPEKWIDRLGELYIQIEDIDLELGVYLRIKEDFFTAGGSSEVVAE